jgi:hypothetical protein
MCDVKTMVVIHQTTKKTKKCTGCFIIFYVIINIYSKKTKGPFIIELFTARVKLKNILLKLEMFDVCTTGDTAHIDTTFNIGAWVHIRTYVDACVARI